MMPPPPMYLLHVGPSIQGLTPGGAREAAPPIKKAAKRGGRRTSEAGQRPQTAEEWAEVGKRTKTTGWRKSGRALRVGCS